MKKVTFFTLATAAVLLAGASAAQAVVSPITPSLVTPGDTFSFDVSGFNSAGTKGYLVSPDETATFGATTTFTGVGINGQNITISSSESIGATSTTDTFTVSTPTNFLTTTTISGTTITQFQFDLGNANSGSNTVSLVLPINTYTATGGAVYGTTNGTVALTPTVTLGTGNTSYSAVEGVNNGTFAISTVAVHSFTLAITYTNAIPEPSTYAVAGLGALALGAVLLRRHRRQA